MDIKGAGLYQEMQAIARQARGVSGDMLPIQPQQVPNSSQSDFSALLKTAIDNVNGLQKNSNERPRPWKWVTQEFPWRRR